MSRTATYVIDTSPRSVAVKVKAKNKLLWYDQDENRMLEFEGGKIVPVFDMTKKKLVPKVEDLYYTSYETVSKEDDIRSWIRNYGGRYGAEINSYESSNRGIAVDVEELNRDVFEYALDRSGFRYEML